MTFVDLFCGAGGSGLGLLRAGLRPLLGIDADRRAVAIYAQAVGPALCADVRALDPAQVCPERPWLLWASPPCSPWSRGRLYRGLPGGFDMTEGRLLVEPVRWAERLRPTWVVIENVDDLPADAITVLREALGRALWGAEACL